MGGFNQGARNSNGVLRAPEDNGNKGGHNMVSLVGHGSHDMGICINKSNTATVFCFLLMIMEIRVSGAYARCCAVSVMWFMECALEQCLIIRLRFRSFVAPFCFIVAFSPIRSSFLPSLLWDNAEILKHRHNITMHQVP